MYSSASSIIRKNREARMSKVSQGHSAVNSQRRNLIKAMSAAGLSLSGGALSATAMASTAGDPWLQAQSIIARVSKPLAFRKQDFVITDFGAHTCQLVQVKAWISFEEQDTVNTPTAGSHDCYPAFASAIAACHQAGGGRVLVPAGDWYCAGPVVLLSNVNLHLSAGAHLYFSNNPADYAKYGDFDCGKNGKLTISRWQSNDCLNFSSMIYAYGQDNIALTGDDWTSILDGQGGVPFNQAGDCWWTWKGKLKTQNAVAQGSTPNYVKGKPSQNTENPLNPAALSAIAPALTDAERLLIQGVGTRWRADEQYLPALSEAGVPLAKRVFGMGHSLRPPMIQLIGCTNVLLQGYQVTN